MRCCAADVDERVDDYSYHSNDDAGSSTAAAAALKPTVAPSHDYDDNKSTYVNLHWPGSGTVAFDEQLFESIYIPARLLRTCE